MEEKVGCVRGNRDDSFDGRSGFELFQFDLTCPGENRCETEKKAASNRLHFSLAGAEISFAIDLSDERDSFIICGMVGCFGKTNGDFALDSIVELNVNGFVSNGTGVALVDVDVDVGFGWIIPNRLLKDLFDVRDETVDGAFGVNDG